MAIWGVKNVYSIFRHRVGRKSLDQAKQLCWVSWWHEHAKSIGELDITERLSWKAKVFADFCSRMFQSSDMPGELLAEAVGCVSWHWNQLQVICAWEEWAKLARSHPLDQRHWQYRNVWKFWMKALTCGRSNVYKKFEKRRIRKTLGSFFLNDMRIKLQREKDSEYALCRQSLCWIRSTYLFSSLFAHFDWQNSSIIHTYDCLVRSKSVVFQTTICCFEVKKCHPYCLQVSARIVSGFSPVLHSSCANLCHCVVICFYVCLLFFLDESNERKVLEGRFPCHSMVCPKQEKKTRGICKPIQSLQSSYLHVWALPIKHVLPSKE